MIELLIMLGGSGLLPIGTVLATRYHSQLDWRGDLVASRLRFPRGLDASAVTAFVAGLSGLVASRWVRPFVVRAVMLETTATDAGIEHHLLMPRAHADVVLAALRAALPGVAVRTDESYQPTRPMLAAELALSNHHRVLATDQAESISTAVLASLQPLEAGERVVVQWAASPVGPVGVVSAAPRRSENSPLLAQTLDRLLFGSEYDAETAKAANIKRQAPLFMAVGRVGVTAGSRARAQSRLRRTLAAFHTANAPGVHLHRRALSHRRVSRALVERRLPLVAYPCLLNAAELAAVAAFPLGNLSLPGLRLGGCRQLAPAADIPTTGRVVAQATFPGAERPLALSVPDSLRHLHVIGPTGAGKSTLLLGLITQDMQAGRGVVVIDPKGDLVADVLDRVPAARLQDVVVLDPTDDGRPVGLNLLAGAEAAPELVVDQIVGIFSNLFRASWGPRTDDILRASLLTLAGEPGMTLCEVPLILNDAGFRRRLVGRVDDLVLQQFWGWFDGLSDAERGQVIAPLSNKLRAVLLRRRLRNVLGQARPRLDLDEALSQRKILLAPLSKGLLGEEAAALAGSLLVARVWQAVQRRTAVAAAERPVTFAYIDEFQDYLHLPTSVTDVLAQARGLGLGLTLAHQHLGQLPTAVRDAVLANARSRVIFQVSAGDAKTLARELAPHLNAADLQGLDAYEVAVTLSTGARIAPPATGATLLPPTATGQGQVARQRSRDHYGLPRAEVEAAIRARHEGRPGDGSVGRREASP